MMTEYKKANKSVSRLFMCYDSNMNISSKVPNTYKIYI